MIKKIVFHVQPNRKLDVFKLIVFVFLLLIFCYNISWRKNPNSIVPVDGWEENKTRYAKDYIFPEKFTTHSFIKNPCTQTYIPLMLIIVCSDIRNAKLRQAIRKTWGAGIVSHNVSIYFLVGISYEHDLNLKAIEESLQYNDLIIENILDSYNNLTLKSIMLLKWVEQNCRNVKFIMKVDDDIYINIKNLLQFVKSVDDSKLNNFLVGKLYTREKPHRELSSKWYMPRYMYPADTYPYYLCGVGYVMSSTVALQLYYESLKHEFIYLEDVFLTGICAKELGIKPKNQLEFHFFEHHVTVECNSIHPHLILLSHHLSAEEMYDIHNQIIEC